MASAAILTFHRAINYGAALQCVALHRYLSGLGLQTEIIDYRPAITEVDHAWFPVTPGSPPRQRLRELLSLVRALPRRLRKMRKFDALIAQTQGVTPQAYPSFPALQRANLRYDYYFLGSDQVWNPAITEGLDGAFFAAFDTRPEAVKVSYAPSVGEYKLETEREAFLAYLAHIDHVSVREECTRELLETACGRPCVTVLDPTFLVAKADWLRLARPIDFGERYLFVYSLDLHRDFIEIVDRFAALRNLRVVHFQPRNTYQHELAALHDAGPREFLGLIAHADFVVTNSFHGTAFSIILQQQFAVKPHSKRPERIVNLMATAGLSDRIVTTAADVRADAAPIDHAAVLRCLDAPRARSMAFIDQALHGERAR